MARAARRDRPGRAAALRGLRPCGGAARASPQSAAIALSVAYAPGEWPWSYWLMIGAHLALLVGSAGRVALRRPGPGRARTPALHPSLRSGLVVGLATGAISMARSLAIRSAGRGRDAGLLRPVASLGSYNLVGSLVLVALGGLLLAGVRSATPQGAPGSGRAGRAGGSLLLHAQVGFTDPVLGGNPTSAAFLISLACRRSSLRAPSRTLSTSTSPPPPPQRAATHARLA